MLREMREQLSSEFADRFGRLEEAVAAIANSTAQIAQNEQKKRRLNEAANNPSSPAEETERISGQFREEHCDSEPPEASTSTANRANVGQTYLRTLQTKDATSRTGGPGAIKDGAPQLRSSVNKEAAHHSWLLSNMVEPSTHSTVRPPPMSTHEAFLDEGVEGQVKQILECTASHLSATASKTGFFPFKYVRRGPDK